MFFLNASEKHFPCTSFIIIIISIEKKFVLQVILQTIKWYTAMNIPVEQLYIILQYLA